MIKGERDMRQKFTKEKSIEETMKKKSINKDNHRKKQVTEEEIIEKIAGEYTSAQGKKIEEEIQKVNSSEREEYEDKIKINFEDILAKANGENKSKRMKAKRKTSSVFYKVAAAAAVLLLMLDVSIVAVPAFRMNMLRFFEKSAVTHTRIEAESESGDEIMENQDKYRIGPEVEYGVSYLPEDFQVVSEERGVAIITINYEDSKGNSISFFQNEDSSFINFDTEDAGAYHRIINGDDVLITVKDNRMSAVWRVDGYLLWLDSEGISESELLKIVESVKKQ